MRTSLTALLLAAAAQSSAFTVDFGLSDGGWIPETNMQGGPGFSYDALTSSWVVQHGDTLYTTLTSPVAYDLGSAFSVSVLHTFSTEAGFDFGWIEYSANPADVNSWTLVNFAAYNDGSEGAGFGFNGPLASVQTLESSQVNTNAFGSSSVYLRLVFEADSSAQEGDFYRQWAVSSITASAVPEPSTYGLALGCLALVGAVIRRRRSK